MATIRLKGAKGERLVPLCPTTTIGRDRSCVWTVSEPEVPTHWIELRWSGEAWGWRCLSGEARTVGPNRPEPTLPPGWRALRRGQQVRLADQSIKMIDALPPFRFAVDRQRGDWCADEALEELIVEFEDGWWPASVESSDGPTQPLKSGDDFVENGRVWRFHDVTPPTATEGARVDLRDPSTTLLLDLSGPRARLVVEGDAAAVEVAGNHVWAALPYFESRLQSPGDRGWLDYPVALESWRARFPFKKENDRRLTQDRSRLGRMLAAAGLQHAKELFETQCSEERRLARLSPAPERLTLVLP